MPRQVAVQDRVQLAALDKDAFNAVAIMYVSDVGQSNTVSEGDSSAFMASQLKRDCPQLAMPGPSGTNAATASPAHRDNGWNRRKPDSRPVDDDGRGRITLSRPQDEDAYDGHDGRGRGPRRRSSRSRSRERSMERMRQQRDKRSRTGY